MQSSGLKTLYTRGLVSDAKNSATFTSQQGQDSNEEIFPVL